MSKTQGEAVAEECADAAAAFDAGTLPKSFQARVALGDERGFFYSDRFGNLTALDPLERGPQPAAILGAAQRASRDRCC